MGFRACSVEGLVSMSIIDFYRGKRVLVTGHTGFKGTWLSAMLTRAGAEVTGYALAAPTAPSLFEITDMGRNMRSIIGDIRDLDALKQVVEQVRPEIVFHLAAQPIVRESYQNPHYTYETNVMGTVNVLECIRLTDSVASFLNVTTDKVYENREWAWGYRENERLNGQDPYSNSKSCSELVTHSYRSSFLGDGSVAISTARAGNVIGGGDFAKDRIVPDCVRAATQGTAIVVRNPYSTRPYQHVLEPLFAYLMIAARQYADGSLAGSYNVGPDEEGCCRTGRLVDLFCTAWGTGASWVDQSDRLGPHEASFLKLDCSLLKERFGWRPVWSIEEAIAKTVEWTKIWAAGEDAAACMNRQIDEYLQRAEQTIANPHQ